jgi:hypothetical protein
MFKLFCDRRSVGQSVLVSGYHRELMTRFLLLSDICGLHVAGRPPSREDSSAYLLIQFAVNFRSKPQRTHDHILLSHLRLLASLFVVSYYSRGCSGGIISGLHTGNSETQVKFKVTLRLTACQSVSMFWCQAYSGTYDQTLRPV